MPTFRVYNEVTNPEETRMGQFLVPDLERLDCYTQSCCNRPSYGNIFKISDPEKAWAMVSRRHYWQSWSQFFPLQRVVTGMSNFLSSLMTSMRQQEEEFQGFPLSKGFMKQYSKQEYLLFASHTFNCSFNFELLWVVSESAEDFVAIVFIPINEEWSLSLLLHSTTCLISSHT